MTEVSAASYIDDNARTEAEFKTWLEEVLAALKQQAGGPNLDTTHDSNFTQTLATGVLTPTQWTHIVAAETGTADDLDQIVTTNMQKGALLLLKPDSGDTITVKHNSVSAGTGRVTLRDAQDYALGTGTTHDFIILQQVGGDWEEIFKFSNVDWVGGSVVIGDTGISHDTSKLIDAAVSSGDADVQIRSSATDSDAVLGLRNDAREFRIFIDGSDSDKNKLHQQGVATRVTIDTDGKTGFGTTTPEGASSGSIHIETDTGGATVSTNADELVVKGPATTGISIISKDNTATSNLYFGDDSAANVGRLVYDHVNDRLQIFANSANIATVDSSPAEFRIESGYDLLVTDEIKGSRLTYTFTESGSFSINNSSKPLKVGEVQCSSGSPGKGIIMPRAGSIVSLSCSYDVTATSASTVDVESMINTNVALQDAGIDVAVADNKQTSTTQARDTAGSTFTAGQAVWVQITNGTALNITMNEVVVSLEVVFDT